MLVVLVGLKGIGKSYIGHLLERSFGVRFLRVNDETRAKPVLPTPRGFAILAPDTSA